MRRLIISLCFVFSVLSIICSCGGTSSSNKSGTDSIMFDSIKMDSTVFLTEDTAGPRCHISLCLTYAKGKNAEYINDSIIRSGVLCPDYFSITPQKISVPEAADSFMTRYLNDYKVDYGSLYKADKTHGSSYNCEYIVKTYVSQEAEDYYTYIANIYSYGGGAHGSSVIITKNIDKKSGKIVSLKDLFVPGYEIELNDLIVKNLCKTYNVKNLNELNEKSIFMGIDVYPSDNFIINDDGITFIYSPDEIAYHAAGEIRVDISNSELENIFKKK